MAIFAVVRSKPDDDFKIIECHLNLWSLAGMLGRRVFYWDVGLRLQAVEKEVTEFQLALPIGTYGKESNGIEDLHELLINQHVGQLVFGRPVKTEGAIIQYKSSTLGPTTIEAVRIKVGESERIESLSGKEFSVWKLILAEPIKNEPNSYIRVRFRIRNPGRTWIWKKSGFAKNGALVDLRITDIRSSNVQKDWKTFQSRIVPIENLNLFVIAPFWLQYKAMSPTYHYMRLFEGRVWEKYLERAVDRRRKEKLIIYQWRNKAKNEGGGDVDTDNPFHAFLDLSREFGVLPFANYLRIAVVTLILIILTTLAVLLYPNYALYVESIWGWRLPTITAVASAIIGILWILFRNVERFQKLFKSLRDKSLNYERNRFRKNIDS